MLRGLPTPGSYTVVVSADGYSPATLNLTLTAGQQLTGVSVVLGRDQASLAGPGHASPAATPRASP